MNKKVFIYPALMLAVLASVSCSRGYDVTMESLLDEMVSREALTYFPERGWLQKQASSYDRRSVSPDSPGWFANRDWTGYERMDTTGGRIEKVMMECSGPGVIDRIWMTTKGKRGTLRFYFDGSSEPGIVIPAYDMKRFPIDVPAALSLTHTHYDEDMDGVGGNTFFMPVPFADGCRVTFEEETQGVDRQRYFQINWRAYEPGTKVRTYTAAEAESLLPKMRAVSDALSAPAQSQGTPLTAGQRLAPGESFTVALPSGPQAVKLLRVKTSGYEEYGQAMEGLHISGAFDGITCIDACLAEFFGAGFGAPDVEGWWLSNHEGEASCRYLMPYREDGSITIANGGKSEVSVSAEIITGEYAWKDNSMYFHCSSHSEDGIPVSNQYDSDDNLDWNFTTIDGRGVYCGDLLTLYNYCVDWYGEGDEKIWVDDDSFPSHFGTGTEDYYNCSWAPVVPFLTPYGGAPRADELSSHGFNAYLRTRNLDVVPFTKRFRFDIEMLSWNPGSVDYHTVSWWYGDKEAKAVTE